MHPAKSVIYFTTASGAGYGLFIFAWVMGAFFEMPAYDGLGIGLLGTSFFFISTGLLSSTFHLGHPERIWRAFSQWRSSWLSREGVLAMAFFVPALIFAWGWLAEESISGVYQFAGGLASVLALMTVFSTGKIYSTLKAVPAWFHPLTVPLYLSLSLLTGGVLFLTIGQFWFLDAVGEARLWVLGVSLISMVMKMSYWVQIKRDAKHTATSATGLKGEVSLLEGPHDQKNYLMKEMGYDIARKHADKLRSICLGLLFMMPFAAMALSAYAPSPDAAVGLLTVATFFTMIGIMIERWLFFAEAKHVVMLYYGEDKV